MDQPNLFGWEPPAPRPPRPPISYRDRFIVFYRDGFIDRYTGRKVILPPALRIIARLRSGCDDETKGPFAYDRSGNAGRCHPAQNLLQASIDHIKPLKLGGAHDHNNWVTTSFTTNASKGSGVRGWRRTLWPPGDGSWDGWTARFTRQYEADPALHRNNYFRDWYRAIMRAA